MIYFCPLILDGKNSVFIRITVLTL